MISHTAIKLGKKAPTFDPRTLKFAKYATALPVYPASCDNFAKFTASWGMLGNDTLGDCVEAAGAHSIDAWNSFSNIGRPLITEAQTIAAYSTAAGYVTGNPDTDNGTDMLTFLKDWRNQGLYGEKIVAFVQLKPGNLDELRQAVYLFGVAFIGLALPITAQSQAAWTVPGNLEGDAVPGSWGGHCVPVGAYSTEILPRQRNTVITWGQKLQMSDYFYQCYCDEAYAVLSVDWLNQSGLDPTGFNLAQLQADLSQL